MLVISGLQKHVIDYVESRSVSEGDLGINLVHISPWKATVGLFESAGRLLGAQAPLVLYGPYTEDGVETAPSNLAFDESLRSRDPRWGLRRLSDMDGIASKCGFRRTARHVMPANNLTLVYRRT